MTFASGGIKPVFRLYFLSGINGTGQATFARSFNLTISGIEAIFKYNYARSKFNTDTGGVTTSTTTKPINFPLSMGLQYYFGGLRRVRN
ncbi:MAG: hypothetical protein IPJ82_08780 [Lewinellaceae bacterium]|nr:hypothetical protein [Lewinellaceae bacterium]